MWPKIGESASAGGAEAGEEKGKAGGKVKAVPSGKRKSAKAAAGGGGGTPLSSTRRRRRRQAADDDDDDEDDLDADSAMFESTRVANTLMYLSSGVKGRREESVLDEPSLKRGRGETTAASASAPASLSLADIMSATDTAAGQIRFGSSSSSSSAAGLSLDGEALRSAATDDSSIALGSGPKGKWKNLGKQQQQQAHLASSALSIDTSPTGLGRGGSASYKDSLVSAPNTLDTMGSEWGSLSLGLAGPNSFTAQYQPSSFGLNGSLSPVPPLSSRIAPERGLECLSDFAVLSPVLSSSSAATAAGPVGSAAGAGQKGNKKGVVLAMSLGDEVSESSSACSGQHSPRSGADISSSDDGEAESVGGV